MPPTPFGPPGTPSRDGKPRLSISPVPRFDLITFDAYVTMGIQTSRGCPFDCEFCDIVLLNGRVPRTKDVRQLIEELEAIHRLGCCSTVFIVDDNFIGNKKKLKAEVLPAIIEWMKEKGYPFTLFTQASIGLGFSFGISFSKLVFEPKSITPRSSTRPSPKRPR